MKVSLPTFTAAAHYHQKLPADLQADRNKALAESRSFADGDYPRALRLGAGATAIPATYTEAVAVRPLAAWSALTWKVPVALPAV